MSQVEEDGVQEAGAGSDALAEALAIIDGANERGIAVRLLGGLAVRALTPDYPPRSTSPTQDIDLASITPARKGLQEYLVEQGYQPDKTFNALYGHKQMYFISGMSGRPVDVLVDALEMCHVVEFKDRITRLPHTLDVVDVLMSKLQVVQINEKDVRDSVYLLSAYPVESGDNIGTISLKVFEDVVSKDWGWWRTATMNLGKLQALVRDEPARLVPEGAKFDPAEQAAKLAKAAEDTPKSRGWKLRSRLGDRKRWYNEPEESTH